MSESNSLISPSKNNGRSTQHQPDAEQPLLNGEPRQSVAGALQISSGKRHTWVTSPRENGQFEPNLLEHTRASLGVIQGQVEGLIHTLQGIQAHIERISRDLCGFEGPLPQKGFPPPVTLTPPKLETILVVEDEASIQQSLKHVLAPEGYTVLTARFNSEALLTAHRYAGPIDLMIADVMLPGISGPDFGVKLAKSQPGMKMIYMSGWPKESVIEKLAHLGDFVFLQKPLVPETLLQTVRKVLSIPVLSLSVGTQETD